MCEEGITFDAHGAKRNCFSVWPCFEGLGFFQIVTQNGFLLRLKRHLFQTNCFDAELELDAVVLL